MKLLGAYNSKLQSFHYEELLNLYKQAIAAGGYAGNQTFDEAAVTTLVQQSKDFANLPAASEGQVVTDDSLNYPLSLLYARYNALISEANSFSSEAEGLISVLEKDTTLLDQLLSAAELNEWVSEQPELYPSTKFSWSFGEGNGPTSTVVPKVDPSNGVTYPSKCPTATFIDLVEGDSWTGLVAPSTTTKVPAKNLQWTWPKITTGEQSEDLYGDGWAELNLLEDYPVLNFLPNPAVQVILPNAGSIASVFEIGGAVKGGSIPIYIKTQFHPRRNTILLTPQNALPDASFEAGGAGWTLGTQWTIQTTASAHSGSKVAQKAPIATAWTSVGSYLVGDTVHYLGIEYICIQNAPPGTVSPDLDDTLSYWNKTGYLVSPSFPLSPLGKIYVEGWILNQSGDGIVNISLTCLDVHDTPISPDIYIPGITSADQWLEFSEVLTALDDSRVASGVIRVSTYNMTTGNWWLDDFRVHLPNNISSYQVNQDNVEVYTQLPNSDMPAEVFFQNEHFIIDDSSNVTLMGLTDGTQYACRFTENYPAYQCSVNETTFSPLIMLDPDRPYPDDATDFEPVIIGVDSGNQRTLFPITDETGKPTGLTLKMIGQPLYEYYFLVTTPATTQYGVTAQLEIDLQAPQYMNGLMISPFSEFPMRLVKVETQSFTPDTRQTVGAPNILLDRPIVLTFPKTLLSKVFLTCYQENYTLTELAVEPPDALRRQTLYAVQTVLPFNVRRPQPAKTVYYRGAQYAFGLEGIAAINEVPVLPGVFVSGPRRFYGCPDVFRFDADFFDEIGSVSTLNVYLCWIAYSASNVVLNQELSGYSITPGECAVWPFPNLSLLDRSQVDHVDIFLKFVLRNQDTVVQRYLLQVSNAH